MGEFDLKRDLSNTSSLGMTSERIAPREQSLLGRVFDSYQNSMQIAACLREMARQRAVAQLQVLELSRRETGLSDYVPEAKFTRYATHDSNRPTLKTPVSLPFPDKSFNGCFATDVYEHIPADLRPQLLREMLRVTNGIVLIGCPQGNEIVPRFDRVVFDFIWGKYGERFEPLEQHVGFGLEPIEHTLESVKSLGADRVVALPCNYVYRWIHQILIFFDLQHNHAHWNLFEPLNRIYNERLSPYDYKEPCYRYLIVVPTDPALDLDGLVAHLTRPDPAPTLVAEADAVLVNTFRTIESRLADQLRSSSKEILRLQRENKWLLERSSPTVRFHARLRGAASKLFRRIGKTLNRSQRTGS
jgi:hypothetical protein